MALDRAHQWSTPGITDIAGWWAAAGAVLVVVINLLVCLHPVCSSWLVSFCIISPSVPFHFCFVFVVPSLAQGSFTSNNWLHMSLADADDAALPVGGQLLHLAPYFSMVYMAIGSFSLRLLSFY